MLAAECPPKDELSSYLLGKLPADRLEAISDHMEACGDCTRVAEELEAVSDGLIAQLRQPLPDMECGKEPQLQRVLGQTRSMRPDAMTDSIPPGERIPLLPSQSRLGAYRIVEQLGQGGMGSIYKAVHTQLEKTVALKVLRGVRADDPACIARFRREMVAVGRLEHPNLACAYDAGQEGNLLYLVMQLVDGLDFSRIANRLGPLPIADACEVVRQAAAGLQFAHGRQIVHRDLKPSNLMLSSDGIVKVLDLGLARVVDQPESDELTNSGLIIGTLDYMAPEQAAGGSRVGFAADIYSLGATLYKLLAGRAPFAAPEYDTPLKKASAVSQVPPRPIAELRPDVPSGLANCIMRMLSKQPSHRFQTAGEIIDALAPFAARSDLKALFARAIEATESERRHGRTVNERPAPSTASHQSAPQDIKASHRGWKVAAMTALGATLLLLSSAILFRQFPGQRTVEAPAGKRPGRIELVAAGNAPEQAAGDHSADAETPDADPIAAGLAGPAPNGEVDAPPQLPAVYGVAVLPFVDRTEGLEFGAKISDVVFVQLGAVNNVYLVEREELDQALAEQELSAAGAVASETAIRLGQLTGAEILVMGSVAQIEDTLFLTAKIMSAETSRVVSESVKGAAADDLAALAEQLAAKVAARLQKEAGQLVPQKLERPDRIAALKRKLADRDKPVVWIKVSEHHAGRPTVDPAAETELMLFAKESGFQIIDHGEGSRKQADIVIEGEAFSELASRYRGFFGVKARVEVKAVDRRSGQVLAAERQTSIAVDLAEQTAGKTALQEAAAALAERLLPKLTAREQPATEKNP